MVGKQFYSLPDGYTRVIKKDIYEGKIVFLRQDLHQGKEIPYKYNIVGKKRIGISIKPIDSTYSGIRWVYCSQLCKKV